MGAESNECTGTDLEPLVFPLLNPLIRVGHITNSSRYVRSREPRIARCLITQVLRQVKGDFRGYEMGIRPTPFCYDLKQSQSVGVPVFF